jgi:hypothetical protein
MCVKVICMEMVSPLYGKAFISVDRLKHGSGLQGLIFRTLPAFYDTRRGSVPVGEVLRRASLHEEETRGEPCQALTDLGEDSRPSLCNRSAACQCGEF